MGRKVFVVGVGMTNSKLPDRGGVDYRHGEEARARRRSKREVGRRRRFAGDSTCGQRAVTARQTGIPVNVNNNCSGPTALFMAKQFIEGGLPTASWRSDSRNGEARSASSTPTAQPDGKRRPGRAARHRQRPSRRSLAASHGKYGTARHFAKIGYKNHKHSVNNPYSQFQTKVLAPDILNAPMVYDPLTKRSAVPSTAPALRSSPVRTVKKRFQKQVNEIVGQAMTSDFESTLGGSCISDRGRHDSQGGGEGLPAVAGPENVDVIGCDCLDHELVTYGLALRAGQGRRLIDSGAVTYGGNGW
jgi:hypothetical protein